MAQEPRKRRKEERPAEILGAAMDVFSERGFVGTRMEDVARRAGVAKGTVYLYFPTKEALLEAAIRKYIAPVFADVERMARSMDGSATDILCALLTRMYTEMVESPMRRAILRILIAEGERFPELPRFYHQEILGGARAMLSAILQRGVEAGEFRHSPVLDQPQVLIGPVMLASVWRLTFEATAPLDVEAHMRAHLDLVLHGILAD